MTGTGRVFRNALVFGSAPVLQKLRSLPSARAALDGMNAAVVGLLIVIALRLAWVAIRFPDTGRADPVNVSVLLVGLVLVLIGINGMWLILGSGVMGLVRWYF